MLLYRGHRYRIYPTPEQEARLLRWENALRFLWNLALEQRLMCLDRRPRRVYLTAFDQGYELKQLRADLPWLADVPRHACDQLLFDLNWAWQLYFKKLAQEPRWKKRGQSVLRVCEFHHKAWRIKDDRLRFPKLGWLPIILHRPLRGTPKGCTIKRDGDQWFATIVCEVEIADPDHPQKPTVAIDLGVVNTIADSNGRIVPNPKHFEAIERRLKRAQRRVAKKKKGSKNCEKVNRRVARLHRKARRQREHFLHNESLHYAKNHGTVVVEKLQIVNMTASAKGTVEKPGTNVRQKAGLNRAILRVGWYQFVDMLNYKLEERGGQLVKVSPAHSSQTCSACGVVDSQSRVSQSQFICVACGHQANADINAAKVLLSRRADGDAVCGGSGIGRPVKQKLRAARRASRDC